MSTEPKIKYPYRFVDPTSEYPDNRDIFVVLHVRSALQWTKILSAGLEGAYLLYPDDHHDVSVPLMEYVMNCESIASCLVNNPDFIEALSTAVENRLNDKALQKNQNDYDNADDGQVSTADLDAVWGGCKEVNEYWLDILKTICFFLEGVSNFVDLGEQVYNANINRRYGETPYLEGGQQKQLQSGVRAIELAGGGLREIPSIILQLVGGIAQTTFVGIMSDIANVGIQLALADINDERLEALSCILMNLITCDPNNQRKEPPYIFSTDTMQTVMSQYLTDPNAGIAGFCLGVLGNITLQTGGVFTVFPVNESLKEYETGLRSPSDEWEVICDICPPPMTGWTQEFDFTGGNAWSFVSSVANESECIAPYGWVNKANNAIANYRRAGCSRVFSIPAQSPITRIEVHYEADFPKTASWTWRTVLNGANYNYPQVIAGTHTQVIELTTPLSGNVNMTTFMDFAKSQNRLSCRIRKVVLSGDGSNPF